MMWDWTWGWGMGLGMFFTVLFWIIIIALIVWIIVRLTRRENTEGDTDKHKPIDIARERYAKGEINHEEFEQIKKDLT
jgi:putative membrane protein